MRIIKFLYLAAMLILPSSAIVAAENGRVTAHALLVVGSNQSAKSDPRLARYEPNLRRILHLESFRLAGEGSATLAPLGKGAISVGSGQLLELQSEKSDGKGVYLRVNWRNGDRTVINNGREMSPGVPMILVDGSAGKGQETFAVILVVD